MNPLDWTLALTLLYSIVRGVLRGFFREAFALGGLVAGILLACWFFRPLAVRLGGLIATPSIAQPAAFILIVVAVAVAASLLGRALKRRHRPSALDPSTALPAGFRARPRPADRRCVASGGGCIPARIGRGCGNQNSRHIFSRAHMRYPSSYPTTSVIASSTASRTPSTLHPIGSSRPIRSTLFSHHKARRRRNTARETRPREPCLHMHAAGVSYTDAVREFKKRYILEVLARHRGNQCKAAEELGMHRNTLSRTLTELELDTAQIKRGLRRPVRSVRPLPAGFADRFQRSLACFHSSKSTARLHRRAFLWVPSLYFSCRWPSHQSSPMPSLRTFVAASPARSFHARRFHGDGAGHAAAECRADAAGNT